MKVGVVKLRPETTDPVLVSRDVRSRPDLPPPSLACELPNDNALLHAGAIWTCDDVTGPPRAELPWLWLARADALDDEAVIVEELDPIDAHVEGTISAPELPAEQEPAEPETRRVLFEIMAPEPETRRALHMEEMEVELDPAPPANSEIMLIGARDTSGLVDLESELDAAIDLAIATPVDTSAASLDSSTTETALPPPPDDPFVVFVSTLSDVAIAADAPHVAAAVAKLFVDGVILASIEGASIEALRAGGILSSDASVSPRFTSTTRAWAAILRGTSEDFSECGSAMLDEWAADVLARLLASPARATSLRQELRSRGVAAFGLVEAA